MTCVSSIALFFLLAAITFKDIREGIIPDFLVCLLALLGMCCYGVSYFFSAFLLGGLGYGLYKAYSFMKNQEGLGLGDVKMMAVSGLWLPLESLPLFLISAGGGGIMTAVLWQKIYKIKYFPLGPALAFALGICIFGKPLFPQGELSMTYSFSGPLLSPSLGEPPDSLVVVIHGYGATGDNLLPLAKAWAPLLPRTLFVAPHGPSVCEGHPEGRQWFGLKDWDFVRILKEIKSSQPALNQYIDGLIKTYNIPPERVAFVGFSQGAMVSILMALGRPSCAGAVAYSGGFVGTEESAVLGKPPILLVHGLQDHVVPVEFSQEAEVRLKELGIPVTLSLLPSLDHSIDERGVRQGGEFLKEILK